MSKKKWTILKLVLQIPVWTFFLFMGSKILFGSWPLVDYLAIPIIMGGFASVISWCTAENFMADGIISEDSFWYRWYKWYSVALGLLVSVILYIVRFPSADKNKEENAKVEMACVTIVKTGGTHTTDSVMAGKPFSANMQDGKVSFTPEKELHYVVNASTDTLVLYSQAYGNTGAGKLLGDDGQTILDILPPGSFVDKKADFIMCEPPDSITVKNMVPGANMTVLRSIHDLPEENALRSNIMIVRRNLTVDNAQCYPWEKFEVKSGQTVISFVPEQNTNYLVNLSQQPLCLVSDQAFKVKFIKAYPVNGYSSINFYLNPLEGGMKDIVPLSGLPSDVRKEAKAYLDSIAQLPR